MRRGLRMLRAQVAMHPGTFAVAIGGAALYALATVASALAVQWVTDNVILPRFEDGTVAVATVVAGAAFIIGVGLVRAVGVVFRRSFAAKGQWQVKASLQEQVLAQYQAQPLAWHSAHGTGELVSHAGVDSDAATEVLAPLPYSLGVVLLIVVSTIWLLATDLVLGGVAVLLFPLLIGVNVYYQHRVDVPAALAQDRIGEVTELVHESFDGLMVVKALGAESPSVGPPGGQGGRAPRGQGAWSPACGPPSRPCSTACPTWPTWCSWWWAPTGCRPVPPPSATSPASSTCSPCWCGRCA